MLRNVLSDSFEVKFGLHKSSVLSQLFVAVIDAVYGKVIEGLLF